jgi:periplasmic protein TonB
MRRQADQIVVTSRFRFTREDGLEATPLATQR